MRKISAQVKRHLTKKSQKGHNIWTKLTKPRRKSVAKRKVFYDMSVEETIMENITTKPE